MCNHVACMSWPEGLQVLACGVETLYILGIAGLGNKHITGVNSLSNASSHLKLILTIQEAAVWCLESQSQPTSHTSEMYLLTGITNSIQMYQQTYPTPCHLIDDSLSILRLMLSSVLIPPSIPTGVYECPSIRIHVESLRGV